MERIIGAFESTGGGEYQNDKKKWYQFYQKPYFHPEELETVHNLYSRIVNLMASEKNYGRGHD